MNRLCLLASLLLAACAAPGDHYHPLALNEAAMEHLAKGDVATARILLERAARIAPHDSRIIANRDALAALPGGATPQVRIGQSAAAAPAPAAVPLAVTPVPPIWPAKERD